jgi:hypothetical protein
VINEDVDATLLRFLHARKHDVDAAYRQLVSSWGGTLP